MTSQRKLSNVASPVLPTFQVSRRLPIPGQVLVPLGRNVAPGDILARAGLVSGTYWTIPVAKQLEVTPEQMADSLLVRQGDRLKMGQLIAQQISSGRESRAPASGIVESILLVSGQVVFCEEQARPTSAPIILRAADCLNCQPRQLPELLWRKLGDEVSCGDLLAGKFSGPALLAPISGRLTDINWRTGELALTPQPERIELKSGLFGSVQSVETDWGCVIQGRAYELCGKCRLGGEAFGRLQLATADRNGVVNDQQITTGMSGCVLIVDGLLTAQAYFKARALGVSGLITGGIHLADLLPAKSLGTSHLFVWNELLGTTLLLTEGFGAHSINQDCLQVLQSYIGRWAFIGPLSNRATVLIFDA